MKNHLKIRLSVFLCILMVLPSIISILPMTAQEVSAASNVYLYWNYEINSYDMDVIEIEKGQRFYIGDYAYLTDGSKSGCASQFSKAKYTSSKKSVITINSKGILTAKKSGKSKVTIKYGGKSISKVFEVVPAGSFDASEITEGLQQKLKKITNNMPSKITTSNGYKYLQTVIDYENYVSENSEDISAGGVLKDISSYTNQLAVPQAGRYYALTQLMYQYSSKNSPTATSSSKILKPVSASATTKAIKVKTKQKATAAHILATDIYYIDLNDAGKKTAKCYVTITDVNTNKVYPAIATITKGSKTISIVPIKRTYDSYDEKYTIKKLSLKKGHTYQIGSSMEWGNGIKVKVK